MSASARVHVRELNVNELKVGEIERRISGYYKLNKAELIEALETHPSVNEQVLPV